MAIFRTLNLETTKKVRYSVTVPSTVLMNDVHRYLKNRDLAGHYTVRGDQHSGLVFWFTDENTSVIFKLRFG